MSLHRAVAVAVAVSAAAVFAGYTPIGVSRLDVDSFLTTPDTVLVEALVNEDFLYAAELPNAECSTLAKGHAEQVVPIQAPTDPRLPKASARQLFMIQPPANENAWLLLCTSNDAQSCHGPLPAKAFVGLVRRTPS